MKIQNQGPAALPFGPAPLLAALDSLRTAAARQLAKLFSLRPAEVLSDSEQRKLRIFHRINLLQLLTGLLIPAVGLLTPSSLPDWAWYMTCWPAGAGLVVLALSWCRLHEASLFVYFLLYPLLTCLVYHNGISPGMELSFLLFVVLAVFFLHDVALMLFAIGFSLTSFFILGVVLDHYMYDVETENKCLFLLNKGVSLGFIFYGLYLVKQENTLYQHRLLQKGEHLAQQNAEIDAQKTELSRMNAFKVKLFSIIGHDLRSPLYALRTLFQNVHRYNPPAEDVKAMVPGILRDLDYTTSLMENLLQWAKSQMQAGSVNPQPVNLGALAENAANLLRLASEAKGIRLRLSVAEEAHAVADKDMLYLVLRNLLSNAVKFTPEGGRIELGVNDLGSAWEVYVQDSGVGMAPDALEKIRQKVFYSTTGTASESGTGLGLLLCHEFLQKNGSELHIESQRGKGSTLSFTLPKQG